MSRSTVVAGKSVGGAVARNRAKRRLRHAMLTTEAPAGFDLVVVATGPEAVHTPWPALREQVRQAIAASAARTRGSVARL